MLIICFLYLIKIIIFIFWKEDPWKEDSGYRRKSRAEIRDEKISKILKRF